MAFVCISLQPLGCLKEDFTVHGARHLLFETSKQLEILDQAKRWYIGTTFKVLCCKDTCEQLFGIHAFLKSGKDTKQVLLAFVFMSRRHKRLPESTKGNVFPTL